jgi:hypothetical protein
MSKFIILWLLFTVFIVSFIYMFTLTTKDQTKTWSRRIFVIGAVVAIVLSILMFIEGNL